MRPWRVLLLTTLLGQLIPLTTLPATPVAQAALVRPTASRPHITTLHAPPSSVLFTPPTGYAQAAAITMTTGTSALAGGSGSTPGYTVQATFSSSTTPTAAQIYTAIGAWTTTAPDGSKLDAVNYPHGYPSDLSVWYQGTQIDADVRTATPTTVTLSFKLQAPLAASSTDGGDYILAWANAAPTVKDTLNNVYLWGDNFTGTTLNSAYNLACATAQVTNNVLTLAPTSGNPCGASIRGGGLSATTDYQVQADVQIGTNESTWTQDNTRLGLSAREMLSAGGNQDNGYLIHMGPGPQAFLQDNVAWSSAGGSLITAGTWTSLRFQIVGSGAGVQQGKAWTVGAAEPAWTTNTTNGDSIVVSSTPNVARLTSITNGGDAGVNPQYRYFRVLWAVASPPTLTSGPLVVAPSGGAIAWHPHQSMAVGGDVNVSVDLADGHADVTTRDLSIPGRGLGLAVNRIWDSALAASGASPTGGWSSSLTSRMGGVLTGTVLYTDTSGAVWAFPYQGNPTDAAPYTTYRIPPGMPWQLSTSSTGYVLTNFLSGETLTFDAQGRLLTSQDSYGNTNTLSYTGNALVPSQETNSGGRTLTFATTSGLLSDMQSPLWQSTGGAQGQHVTYSYNASGQLTSRTRGAGTPDAVTTTFGYSGTQLVTLTTPSGEAFTLGYNTAGQVVSLTSPATGTVGQAGYTPSYTTKISYLSGATQVSTGYGTTAALTTIYTLDGQGEALVTTDGLGHARYATYDADHDVLTRTDANNNVTTNIYQYAGPTGSVGLLTRTSSPPVASTTFNATPAPLVTTYSYGAGYDLVEIDTPNGGVTKNTYDGHHGLYASARLVSGGGGNAVWRGSITVRDAYGEPSVSLDPRGVAVPYSGGPVAFGPQAASYESMSTYDAQGDLSATVTPPLTTTTAGITTTAPVTTSYGYDLDGNQTSMTTPNGNTTRDIYDHLGRQVQTLLPPVPVAVTGGGVGPHVQRGVRTPATVGYTAGRTPGARSGAIRAVVAGRVRTRTMAATPLSPLPRARLTGSARTVRGAAASRANSKTLGATAPLLVAATDPLSTTSAAISDTSALSDAYGHLPLSFEANQGQTDGSVRYVARGAGYSLYLTGTDAVLALTVPPTPTVPGKGRAAQDTGTDALSATAPLSETALRLRYSGANATPTVEAQGRLPGDANYLIGSDPSAWRTNVPTYARIVYHDLYPGIDLSYYGTQGHLEYDWTVAPGASISALTFSVDGAKGLSQNAGGDLDLQTAAGVVRLYAPSTYQVIHGQRHTVAAHYVLTNGSQLGVSVGAYDATQPLVVDPILGYSTYLGGSGGTTNGTGIAVDGGRSTYVVGITSSPNFPQQNPYNGGVFQGSNNDAFVTKFSPDGQRLVYSTYLGGNGDTQGFGIAVNGAGNAYVTGFTWANNYPTTTGAYQTAFGGGKDAFATELGATGASLAYSTYLGGGAYDAGQAIALDGAGHVYLTGNTVYDNLYGLFPTTPGAYQATFKSQGTQDPRNAFVAELDPSQSGTAGLLYSTLLGGTGLDMGQGIAVSGQGVAVTGWTSSSDFPTTSNAIQGAFGSGTKDAFLAVIAPDLTKTPAQQLVYSTYLGSGGDTEGAGVAVDGSGTMSVVGSTTGGFPTTAGGYQQTYGGGAHDAFLARVSMDGGLAYGTYLGGAGDDAAGGVAVDGSGDAYVTGYAASTNFPVTANAFQRTNSGRTDAFVAEVGAGMTGTVSLVSSSYLGGSGADYGASLALDSMGNAYLTGNTNSTNFTTVTPYSSTAIGSNTTEAFVTKVGTALAPGIIDTIAGGATYGSGGDNGVARQAQLNYPTDVAVDAAGDVFIADYYNSRVREVLASTGIITTVAGTGAFGYSGDGGPAGQAQLNGPQGLALDGQGNLYISDGNRVREVGAMGGSVSANSTITTIAGTGTAGYGGDGGAATAALLNRPLGLTLDAAGNLYIADASNNRVRIVSATTKIITTLAGAETAGYGGDGGPANQAQLNGLQRLALDKTGDLFIADYGNNRVREVLASSGSISANSTLVTVAGTGTAGYGGDGGSAGSASFNAPSGVALDSAGNLYIADLLDNRVREVAATGGLLSATSIITTVAGVGPAAGTPGVGYGGDDSPAVQAHLNSPRAVTVDSAGNLYIADQNNDRVREVGGLGPVSLATAVVTPTTSTHYDLDGRATATTDANGQTSTTTYDPLGRTTVQVNPLGATTITTYTATEMTQARDAQGNVTTYSYDGAGRRTLTTEPVTGTLQYGYDAVGNTVAITSADTSGNPIQTQTSVYDALNRVVSTSVTGAGTPPTTLTTLTAYTPDGQTAVVQQPNGEQTTTSYDLADEVTSVVLLSNGTTTTEDTYGYDAAGNQATHTDADGRTTTTVYDPAGRVTQTMAAGGSTLTTATTTVYDPNGNSVAETVQTTDSAHPGQTQTATHAATYDAEDRQTTETDNGLTTAYTYDAAGQQRGQSVQEGQTAVTTAYDGAGRVTSMSEGAGGAGPYVSTFGYNANDQLQTVTLPGGVQESMGYDANSQLVGVTAVGPNTGATGAASTHLSSQYGYTYDAAGRVSSVTTLSGTDSLAYDGASRLVNEAAQGGSTQVIAKDGVYHWTYDANGNILTAMDDSGATNVYTYSVTMPDEVAQMGTTGTPLTKTTAYSYDTRGDVTRIANTAATSDKNALVQTLSYDGQGRVVQVTYLDHGNSNTPTTIALAYNADGQRSEYALTPQGQPTLDTRFQYRNGELAEQKVISDTASGPVVLYVNTYLYGPQGQPLELLHAQPGQTTARYWYVLDGQGNVVALTDANGVVVDRYAYDQWGEATSNDKTDEHVPQQLRYGGYWYDEKLSWYWLSVRYYDPETARFLQPDPSEQDGVQTYAYVGDDPVNATDPSGLSAGFKTPPSWLASTKWPISKKNSPQPIDPLNVVITSLSRIDAPALMRLLLWLPVANSSNPSVIGAQSYTEKANVGQGSRSQAYTWRDGGYSEFGLGGNHARAWPQPNGGGTAWFLAVSEEFTCTGQPGFLGIGHCIRPNGFNQGRDDFVKEVTSEAQTAFCSFGVCQPVTYYSYDTIPTPSEYRPGRGTSNVRYDGRVAVITLN